MIHRNELKSWKNNLLKFHKILLLHKFYTIFSIYIFYTINIFYTISVTYLSKRLWAAIRVTGSTALILPLRYSELNGAKYTVFEQSKPCWCKVFQVRQVWHPRFGESERWKFRLERKDPLCQRMLNRLNNNGKLVGKLRFSKNLRLRYPEIIESTLICRDDSPSLLELP